MSNDVIKENMIFLDRNIDDREEIINYILKEAEKENLISEISDLKQAIIKREEEVSTAVGFGVAMPHGKSQSINQPFVSFLRVNNSLIWSQDNDEKVRMIILIAVPEDNVDNTHLKIISSLSKKLLDDDFREQLMNENETEKVYHLLQSINNS